MTLEEARILLDLSEDLRRVEYGRPGLPPERGTVMKVTEHYVFVAYDRRGGGWWATLPEDLTAVP
jgi:hypothetical protein